MMKFFDKIRFTFHKMNSCSSIYKEVEKDSKLGSGGNGDVKKVICIETGEELAMKCLNEKAKTNKEKKLRFEDEINTMLEAVKVTDGIIPIWGYSQNECWYVMPIAESIQSHINSIDEIINGILQIAETLVILHSKGLSHRDIKPDNMLFYKGRWVLCDFGLVDIPDNPHNLTKNRSRVGAIKTIAPEMSRNAKSADGKKADVYSLAKSLWIMLTKNNDSFEGHYVVNDDSISLHQYEKLRDEHLIEIDELLSDATQNNPDERPTMYQFVVKLKKWQVIKSDIKKQQLSNWNFLEKYLFREYGPQRCTWEDPVKIKQVLNLLSLLPLYSHIFLPDKGWVEYQKVDIGSEPSSLDMYTSFGIFRIRLGKLHYESFQLSFWNYFMLEADPINPIVGTEVDEYSERVVEDIPEHFVSAVDAIYGVYSYDSGEKLPQGAKVLIRYLKGKFLVVLKFGPYNSIPQANDGRHNNCSNDEFRKYIEELQSIYTLDFLPEIRTKLLNDVINYCPFKPQINEPTLEDETLKNNQNFVKGNWNNFNFRDIIEQYSKMPIGKAKYRFVFHHASINNIELIIDSKEYYLCKDGHICEMDSSSTDIYEATDRNTAININKGLEMSLTNYCSGKVMNFDLPYFMVEITKASTPTYLFTKDDIKKLMIEADDRKNNTLVIDEEGYPHIITDYFESKFYPVVNETWHIRNNYVGKYSKLSELTISYHYSLGKWRDYLKSGIGQKMDDYDDYHESEEELIKDIQSLIQSDTGS